jgi:hypothetical protein
LRNINITQVQKTTTFKNEINQSENNNSKRNDSFN